MANLIVSYDLNGPYPTHQQVDDFMSFVGTRRGRALETLWWVDYPGSYVDLRNLMMSILGSEDRLMVCECSEAAWSNLLVTDESLKTAWENAA